MLNKVCSLARALAILLAVVSGFIAIPGLNVTLAIVVLGLISGIIMQYENFPPSMLMVLALPVIGAAVGNLPMIGAQLNAVAGGLALGAASGLATFIAMLLFTIVKGDLTGLGAK